MIRNSRVSRIFFDILKLPVMKVLLFFLTIIFMLRMSACVQTITPELKINCTFSFPEDSAEYKVKILEGNLDTLILNDIKIYKMTFYEVEGGHSIFFGIKFNDVNGFNTPRLYLSKNNKQFAKYSYNDIMKMDSFSYDSLIVYKIEDF